MIKLKLGNDYLKFEWGWGLYEEVAGKGSCEIKCDKTSHQETSISNWEINGDAKEIIVNLSGVRIQVVIALGCGRGGLPKNKVKKNKVSMNLTCINIWIFKVKESSTLS